ncbi:T9SS type A sorting domain-containing protein [Flavobacterium sp. 3HN19-14]|uniref:T9SS type A sorting domain-containing protein n=1 Tax=Flavobacterium sp. 3HN19-14 TaxID=3448133 RepID=UPI003EE0A20B
MKKLLLAFIILNTCGLRAQTISTFLDTESSGCSGMMIAGNYLYVVSSFNGKVFRKALTSTDNSYETFDIGGSGYQSICKIGDFIYVSKPANGAPGIYRFNPDAATLVTQNIVDFNSIYGLASRNSELYFSYLAKIYKLDLSTPALMLVLVADNLTGTAGFNGSTMGLKVYDNNLYYTESDGITKVNLDSPAFESVSLSAFTGTSLALADNGKLYLTGGADFTGIYELDLQAQTYTLLTQIDNFIGTLDIVYANNALFVTTQEGDYDKVAKIDISNLNTEIIPKPIPQVYPNPADDYINVAGLGDENVVIIDQCGKVIPVKVVNGKVDVSGLGLGVYFVKTNNGVVKFVKR